MSEENPSVRESIEAAIEQASTAPGAETSAPAAPQAPHVPAGPSAPAASTPAQGDAVAAAAPGSSAEPASSAAKVIEPPAAQQKADPKQRPLFGEPAKPKAPAAGNQPGSVAAAPELKAPASWRADLREKWKTLPPEVQNEVIRREREHEQNIQQSAPLRRFAERFNEIALPYRALIEAEGAQPLDAFHDYLKTAMLLRNGPPLEKARRMAALIQEYGVPLTALDDYLTAGVHQSRGEPIPPALMQRFAQSNRMPHQVQQPQPQQQFRDPRLDDLLARMQENERTENRRELEAFKTDPKHEFFDDVRGTMADLMDAAEKRGVLLGLEDAYVRACQIVPEVKKVLDARGAVTNASQAARTLAAARHAASSIPSAGAPPAPRSNGAAPPGTVRDSILNAIESLQGAG